MKRLQRVVFFTHADELDRLPCHLANGKGRAAARVAVHFGEHHAGDRKLFVELVGRTHRVLAGHGVGHKQNFLGVEQLLERLHFRHQVVVDVQASGGIDDQKVASGVGGFFARFFGQAFHCGRVAFSTVPS